MQTFSLLIFGALIGAVLGWGVVVWWYFWSIRNKYDIGFAWASHPLPKSFWSASAYLTVIGALIGLAWVVAKTILYPYVRDLGILH
jgi:hypothetical protein